MSERASLLLVDDSASVLAFEKAALSNYYRVATASNGREALEKARELRPDGMVLDLSMPEMDGDEVLKALRLGESTRDMAVLILSTESQRARDCLNLGADDFLVKPSSPEELRARVSASLEIAQRRRASRQEAFLFCRIGGLELGMGLEEVERVVPMLALTALPAMPPWILGWFELAGRPTVALDLAALIGRPYAQPVLDRKLLVLRQEEPRLAVCVDRVDDPEELDRSQIEAAEACLPAAAPELKATLRCLARGRDGALRPVIFALKFFNQPVLLALCRQLGGLAPHPEKKHAEPGLPGPSGRRKNRV